jgi:hypothetical protein
MNPPYVEERPTTSPEGAILDLCYVARNQLYADQPDNFYPQLKDLKKAFTWPATWFNDRALFVGPDRYKQILMERIQEIKRHGDTAGIKYWPRYILTCLQRHFAAEASRYNDEGKAARDLVARTLARLPMGSPAQPAPDQFMRDLATVHTLLKSPGGRRKTPSKPTSQPPTQATLFTLLILALLTSPGCTTQPSNMAVQNATFPPKPLRTGHVAPQTHPNPTSQPQVPNLPRLAAN